MKAWPVRDWMRRPYRLRGVCVKCSRGFRAGASLLACRNALRRWSCLRHSIAQDVIRCWWDCAFSWEREMGGVSTAISVAAFAWVSARSLPTIFLCPGVHAISMRCWFEDSRKGVEVDMLGGSRHDVKRGLYGYAYEYNGGTASSNSLHAATYCLGRMFDFLSQGNTKPFRLHLSSSSL